jgi:KaiC/GvpD/RAD55 family RecA-like ATPase
MNGERVKIGIEGLDLMMGGGLIPGSITAIIGTYGTGKTTFALQFMWEGVSHGEHVIYISLEEREERIYEYMAEKGWDYEPYINTLITVLKLDPSEFNLAINRIKNELPELVRKLRATRVIIDPISLFEDLFDDSALRRQEMFRLEDRGGRAMVLAMTHEEVFTTIARSELRSYRELPQIWYQIQTKFRDESRPKSGLLRVRQFTMKDSYSFDLDNAGLDVSYQKHYRAYRRTFTRCGLEFLRL